MRHLTIFFMMLLLSSCAGSGGSYAPHSGKKFAPTPAASVVELTYEDKLDRPYEEIGVVFAHARSRDNYAKVADLLREKARQAGADAVIKVQYKERQILGVSPFFVSIIYNVAAGEGVAVRYTDRETS